MKQFVMTELNDIIAVKGIYSLHYFEYSKNYRFEGESHNFWELAYVDRGTVTIRADDQIMRLNQGEIFFHRPNEFHTIETLGDYSNTVIISFETDSPAMAFFEHKALKLNKYQRDLIFKIVSEGKESFSGPLNIVDQTALKKNDSIRFGSMQMIKILLEQLFIELVRANNFLKEREKSVSSSARADTDDVFNLIIDYLEKNIDKNVTLDNVCNHFYFSKTYIKTLFKSKTGDGLIAYFNNMKLIKAKQLISLGSFTFTEISEMLSYSSVHYFSRRFKASTGMTPTEYANSIKSTGIL